MYGIFIKMEQIFFILKAEPESLSAHPSLNA